ncbi:Armadillo repeat-containing protein 6 [Chamberlinius hualienensis]
MTSIKTISQETFDGVVRENLEEFQMEVMEAINDAVEQFKAQGVDLYNIVKQVYFVDEDQRIFPSENAKSLVDALSSKSNADILSQLESVAVECNKGLPNRCLLGQYGIANYLMKMLDRSAENWDKHIGKALLALIALTNGQPDILKKDSLKTLLILGKDIVKENICDNFVVGYILKVLYNCCIKHEENRQTLVDEGVIQLIMNIMDIHRSSRDLVVGACSLLRSLTLDDDVRVPFGRAHDHAKMIVTNHSGIQVLLNLAKVENQHVDILCEIIATLSCLTVRNEFCQEVKDEGGLQLIFSCVMENVDNVSLVKSSFSLLKTLAGNDNVKEEIVKAGGVKLVLISMQKYETEPKICEVGCSCLAALSLRSPSNCNAIIEAGGASSIITAMKIHKNEPLVQKYACRAVRDLVSRCRQFCSTFLENGVEDLIREAVIRHSAAVADDAKAALRDLGCKVDLQELWTGQKGAIVQN